MNSHFSQIPSVKYRRVKDHSPYDVKTTMNVGTLYPIDVQEVLPGDTFQLNLTGVVRATTSFIKPIMDNLVLDVYHFYVPYRQVFDDAQKVFGNPSPSMYTTGVLATIPHFNSTVTISEGSVGDYLSIALGTIPSGLSVLPFRCFAKIYNEWFRNQSVDDEVYIQHGALNSETPNSNPWSASNYTGMLPTVCKRKDYFTACLPAPQKGTAVDVPITLSGFAPVTSYDNSLAGLTADYWLLKPQTTGPANRAFLALQSANALPIASTRTTPDIAIASSSESGISQYASLRINPDIVKADLNGVFGSGFSINDLRSATALQRQLEKDALYGSRYPEFCLSHFGTQSPDLRINYTEYLGGGSFPIQIFQVAQTSESSSNSPLANVAGFSISEGESHYMKSFVEHGYVFTLACIRQYVHNYCQGVPKMFTRTERSHFYDPLFAHISEQPVYKSEIYADSNNQTSLRDETKILGYNEAWADYRYFPNKLTGQMRGTNTKSLDMWHLGDEFASAPVLNTAFVHESPVNVDRTLSVPSSSIDNFICDFGFNFTTIRVMPLYSVPGLMDHDVV